MGLIGWVNAQADALGPQQALIVVGAKCQEMGTYDAAKR